MDFLTVDLWSYLCSFLEDIEILQIESASQFMHSLIWTHGFITSMTFRKLQSFPSGLPYCLDKFKTIGKTNNLKSLDLSSLPPPRHSNNHAKAKTLQLFSSFSALTYLDISHSDITSKGLETLSSFQNLMTFVCSDVPISDAGLRNLTFLTSLKVFDLSR